MLFRSKTKLFRQKGFKEEGKGLKILKIVGLILLNIMLLLFAISILALSYKYFSLPSGFYIGYILLLLALLLFIWNCYRIAKRIKALSAGDKINQASNSVNKIKILKIIGLYLLNLSIILLTIIPFLIFLDLLNEGLSVLFFVTILILLFFTWSFYQIVKKIKAITADLNASNQNTP